MQSKKKITDRELIGFASSCDAESLTSPNLEGVSHAIQKALNDAEISPIEVDCINLHGTGTKLNDQTEGAAIKKIFGEQIPLVLQTSHPIRTQYGGCFCY